MVVEPFVNWNIFHEWKLEINFGVETPLMFCMYWVQNDEIIPGENSLVLLLHYPNEIKYKCRNGGQHLPSCMISWKYCSCVCCMRIYRAINHNAVWNLSNVHSMWKHGPHGKKYVHTYISMAEGKTEVSQLLTHWRYCSLTLSHRYKLVKLDACISPINSFP